MTYTEWISTKFHDNVIKCALENLHHSNNQTLFHHIVVEVIMIRFFRDPYVYQETRIIIVTTDLPSRLVLRKTTRIRLSGCLAESTISTDVSTGVSGYLLK